MGGGLVRRPGEDCADVEVALQRFAEYLTGVKGSASSTAQCYSRHVRFLSAVVDPGDAAGLDALSGVQVRSYVTDLGRRYAAETLKLAATSIRSFLGFAWLSGWTGRDLRGAVGPVVTHRVGTLAEGACG